MEDTKWQQLFHLNLPINYQVGNAEKIDFPDDTFDVIYSFGVIHHTPDIQQAVGEIYRVLKPGGKIYIMIYAKYSIVNAIHALFHLPYESPKNLKDHAPVVIISSKKQSFELFKNFKDVSIHTDYPFTYGMRFLSNFLPIRFKKSLGKLWGWHIMIEASK